MEKTKMCLSRINWRDQAIITGPQWGKRLGDLPKPSLQWWIEHFTPTPSHGYQGRELRAALDCAKAELNREKT